MIYPLLKFSFLGNLEMLNHALIQLGGNVPPNVGFQWTCVMVLFISKLFSLSMRKWVLLGRFEAFVENHILIFLWKQHPSYFHEACSLKCFECSCTVETHHSTCHLAKCCTPNLGKQLTVTWFTLVEQYSQTWHMSILSILYLQLIFWNCQLFQTSVYSITKAGTQA